MASKKQLKINDYKALNRKLSGGKVKVSIKSRPIVHNFDESRLAAGPAKVILEVAKEQIASITVPAAASTIAKRKKRGVLSTAVFRDTGKLARGLKMSETTDGFETVAPRDRLSDLPREQVDRLLEIAKITAKDLAKHRKVRKAIEASHRVLIKKPR